MISKAQRDQRQRQDIATTPEARKVLGHIIHDINNSLMLIGITADQLERMVKDSASASLIDSQDSSAPNIILRRNISHIRDMLNEVTQSFDNGDDAKLRFTSADSQQFSALLHHQLPEWRMILPEGAQILIGNITFAGEVHIAPAYLARLFQNLVRNAAEAYQTMPSPTDRLSITLESHVQGTEVLVTIDDNGPGIDKAIAAQIFDAHVSTKPEQALPTGLGLASARELAHLMNGSLELRPQTKTGASFVLSLPLVNTHPPQHLSAK